MKSFTSILFFLFLNLGLYAQGKNTIPVPTKEQQELQDMEMYAFIHYSMNTYTDQEWGYGNEDLKLFNPQKLDCRQWVKTCKNAGMKGIIFTAKHHCGFCMWPSAYTEYSVKNTPWKDGKGDIVRELADACKEYGLKYAVYLSPWDRNHADYGRKEYVTYFRNQLRELLTNYGDMFEVWFDGANGGNGWYGGADETRKIDRLTYYEWEETYRMVRELQPHCVIWNDGADRRGDLRWVGTEAGFIGETNWSMVKSDADCSYPVLHYGVEDGDVWCPGETNTSIRPGWFYHDSENGRVKSLPKLMETYYKSVGRNSTLLLNFPIDKDGLIHQEDSIRGAEFYRMIREIFDHPLKGKQKLSSVISTLTFSQPTEFNRLMICEDISQGQKVKKFRVEALDSNGKWTELHDIISEEPERSMTTIGRKRILCFPTTCTQQIRVTILDSKEKPVIKSMSAYLAKDIDAGVQRKQSLETGWKFHRGGVINAEMTNCDDSKWREVTLPHDFSIEPAVTLTDRRVYSEKWEDVQIGPFTRLNLGDSDQGQMTGGEGWYRKTLRLPLKDGQSMDDYLSRNEVSIQFDGVYNQAEIWINGIKAAMNMYGYMPFVVNLNKILTHSNKGNEICIAVRSLNTDHNSRWYSGSGIFRRVWLITTGKQHLNYWDVFVDGSEVTKKGANIKISAKVFNDDVKEASGEVIFDILDASGKTVASSKANYHAPAAIESKSDKKGVDVRTEILVKSPRLWSDASPYRYKARIRVMNNGEQRDEMTIPFGIRTLEFNVKEGFKLNGVHTKLKGGCVHHDNGLLGAAAIERAEIRKAELLKAQGYNAVRCSHNLPSEAFLNACDSIGLLVMDEVFDQWEVTKRPDDYGSIFSKEKLLIEDGNVVGQGMTNFEYDAQLMVRRDRNHPSVIIWCIGNEIYQRDEPRGEELAKAICKVIKKEDPTRPTTLANCSYWDQPGKTWENDSYRAFANTDLAGYNYTSHYYAADHEKYPERIIVGTENYPGAIGSTWNFIENHPYVIGDFVWTAMDYVGEAGVGHTFERTNDMWVQTLSWPWFNAWCGDIDLTGIKKPQSYYRDIVWRRSNIEMAVRSAIPEGEHEEVRGWGWTAEERHWNWTKEYLPFELRPECYQVETMKYAVKHDVNAHRSDSLRVNVYSREKRVRLLINNRVIGEKDVNPENYTATFWVTYEPGELKAEIVGAKRMKNGMPTSIAFHTTNAPASIRLTTPHTNISASHNELAYIYIDVVDEDGNLCPTAELPLKVETSGVKHIATCGTGHPFDMKSYRTLTPTSFHGKALLIIQPQDEVGEVKIKVTSPNLQTAEYKLNIISENN